MIHIQSGISADSDSEYVDNISNIIVHEMQHLINYNYSTITNKFGWMLSWLNEALSLAAQEIVYPGKDIELRLYGYMYEGGSEIQKGRSLIDWHGDNASYALSAIFSYYLKEQAGDSIFKKIYENYTGNPEQAVVDALKGSSLDGYDIYDILLAYHIAITVNDSYGIYGFNSNYLLDKIRPLFYGSSSASLARGGSIVVKLKDGETFYPDPDAGQDIRFVGVGDFEQSSPVIIDKPYNELRIDETHKLGLYKEGLTSNLIWSSLDENIATVDQNGVITCKNVGEVFIKVTSNTNPNIFDQFKLYVIDKSIKIDSSTRTVAEGYTLSLTATTQPNGNVIWSSTNEDIAIVDKNGVVTGVSFGNAKIMASYDNSPHITDSISITVLAKSIQIDSTDYTVVDGKSTQLTATTNPIGNVLWSSSDESIATIDKNGRVTSISPGKITITATYEGSEYATHSCEFEVLEKKINIDNSYYSILDGENITLTATTNSIGNVVWSSSNEQIAKIDKYGVVTAISPGSVTITATYDDVDYAIDKCDLEVLSKLIQIDNSDFFVLEGETTTLTATTTPIGDVIWSSSDETVATIGEDGVVTGKYPGFVTITAEYNGVDYAKASCRFEVIGKSIVIDKLENNNNIITDGDEIRLTATTTPSGDVVWHSSDELIATVDQNGLVTALYPGFVTITAQYSGVDYAKDTINFMVNGKGIKIEESETSFYESTTITLTAITEPEGTVIWESSNENIATIDQNGIVTGMSPGIVNITAIYDGAEYSKDTRTLEVLSKVIMIDKTYNILDVETETSITATTIPKANTMWESSNENIATIDENGVITTHSIGEFTITATYEGYPDIIDTCEFLVKDEYFPGLDVDFENNSIQIIDDIGMNTLSKMSQGYYTKLYDDIDYTFDNNFTDVTITQQRDLNLINHVPIGDKSRLLKEHLKAMTLL